MAKITVCNKDRTVKEVIEREIRNKYRRTHKLKDADTEVVKYNGKWYTVKYTKPKNANTWKKCIFPWGGHMG